MNEQVDLNQSSAYYIFTINFLLYLKVKAIV